MGVGSAKPSTYVSRQWIDDKDSSTCHRCCKAFNVSRRRHHCRCCGEIFCSDCWGDKVLLPSDYGYQDQVPVCHACSALFGGRLRFLRMPRRIVLTRALKTNSKMERPPLCPEFAASRNFEVFFTKIAHWRPLNDHTHLIFAVTMRTANTNNSSHFNIMHVAPSGKMKLERDETGGPSPATPKASALDLSALRTKQFMDELTDDEATSVPYKSTTTTAANPAASTAHLAVVQGGIKRHTAGNVQLDVAWSLPLDAIIRITLDAHPDGDYIAIETHQEVYRVQVAEASRVTQEQDVATVPFRAGKQQPTDAGTNTPAKRATSPRPSRTTRFDEPGPRGGTATRTSQNAREDEEDEDEDFVSSKPRRNAQFRALPSETNALFSELQAALTLMEQRAEYRRNASSR